MKILLPLFTATGAEVEGKRKQQQQQQKKYDFLLSKHELLFAITITSTANWPAHWQLCARVLSALNQFSFS